MGHNDHIDFELHDRIEECVAEDFLQQFEDDGKIRTTAYGVAQAVIHGETLSPNQQAIFDKMVVPALKQLDALHEKNRIQNTD